jgi:hypothetical protein
MVRKHYNTKTHSIIQAKKAKKKARPLILQDPEVLYTNHNVAENAVRDELISQGYEVSKRGWPDLIAIDWSGGRVRFVEVKGLTERLRPNQEHIRAAFEIAGLVYEVARVSVVDGKAKIESIQSEPWT